MLASFVGGVSTASSSSSPIPYRRLEETEITILAELEREIYHGREALEDAFWWASYGGVGASPMSSQ
jgi:hypothetical protein